MAFEWANSSEPVCPALYISCDRWSIPVSHISEVSLYNSRISKYWIKIRTNKETKANQTFTVDFWKVYKKRNFFCWFYNRKKGERDMICSSPHRIERRKDWAYIVSAPHSLVAVCLLLLSTLVAAFSCRHPIPDDCETWVWICWGATINTSGGASLSPPLQEWRQWLRSFVLPILGPVYT